jgi:predicted transglutaminase-like cysteine proteinase
MRATGLRALASGLALLVAVTAGGADDVRLQRNAAGIGLQPALTLQQLRPLLHRLRALEPVAQLRTINQFFNRHIEFATDSQVWGQLDYWASPLESMQQRRGDCEDYAIAKYFSLVSGGMPVARLRLVYMRAKLDDGPAQAHMVLAYYPTADGDALILDNLVDEVLPAAQRRDLVAVFSFNSDGLWQGLGTVGGGNPAARLTRWPEVLAKARAEGFL